MQDSKIVLYYYPMFEHCMEPASAGVRACRTIVKRAWSEVLKPTLQKLQEGDEGEAYLLHDDLLTSEDDEVCECTKTISTQGGVHSCLL